MTLRTDIAETPNEINVVMEPFEVGLMSMTENINKHNYFISKG
jgi:hypothetical protein